MVTLNCPDLCVDLKLYILLLYFSTHTHNKNYYSIERELVFMHHILCIQCEHKLLGVYADVFNALIFSPMCVFSCTL